MCHEVCRSACVVCHRVSGSGSVAAVRAAGAVSATADASLCVSLCVCRARVCVCQSACAAMSDGSSRWVKSLVTQIHFTIWQYSGRHNRRPTACTKNTDVLESGE